MDWSLPGSAHIGSVALRVSDIDTVAAFYEDVVGLERIVTGEGQVSLGSDGTVLIELRSAGDTRPRDPAASGLYHLAIRVPTRAALGEVHDRLRTRWRLDGASDHGVSEALYCTDPEGTGVEIYRDRPRDEWPHEPDGEVRMTTAPLDLEALPAAGTHESVPAGTDLGHVHLEVSSLVAFEQLYVDTLGFRRRATVPGALFVAAGDYHHHVGANTWHGRSAPADGRGLAWFEVVLPNRDSLATLEERLGDGSRIDDRTLSVTDGDDIEVRFTLPE